MHANAHVHTKTSALVAQISQDMRRIQYSLAFFAACL